MRYKALIVSIKGTKLSKKERILIAKYKPWGVILFKRNLKNISQIKSLIFNIKKLARNKKFPIINGTNFFKFLELAKNDDSIFTYFTQKSMFAIGRNRRVKEYLKNLYEIEELIDKEISILDSQLKKWINVSALCKRQAIP